MAYFHIDRMQRYLQGLGFANVVHRSIPVNLHATAEDNSFYSPTTRALNFGDGGVDDAQDADVISHEYGHAIQDSQVSGFRRHHGGRDAGRGIRRLLAGGHVGEPGQRGRLQHLLRRVGHERGQRRSASLPAQRRSPVDGRPGGERVRRPRDPLRRPGLGEPALDDPQAARRGDEPTGWSSSRSSATRSSPGSGTRRSRSCSPTSS